MMSMLELNPATRLAKENPKGFKQNNTNNTYNLQSWLTKDTLAVLSESVVTPATI